MAVYYFVIGQDGSRYGPADVDTLVAWAREGRLVAQTTLIERGTDRRLVARDISAIAAVLTAPPSPQAVPQAVRIERGDYPTMTHPGHRPGAMPPTPPMRHPVDLYYGSRPLSHRSKLVAGLLGIFLGWLGVHRFYLGYTAVGLIQLVLGILSCGISGIWGLVEGIVCLTGGMPDADGRELRD